MARPLLILIIAALMIAAAGYSASVSTTTAGQITTRDATDLDVRDNDGQLFVIIYSAEGVKQCSFDATVSLNGGRVEAILADDVLGRISVGSTVTDLPEGLAAGRVIPGPVHVDDEGRLKGGYSECEAVGEAAHHAGSATSYYNLYPDRSGNLSYRAWTINGDPVPLQDTLLIINDVENVWEAQFNYALAAGGEDPFNFFGRAHTQLSNVNYSRMDTNTQVAYFCAGATTACFYVTSRIGGQINRAIIVYGPTVWGDPNDWFQHGLAHEFGHGFALLHHLPNCGWVMSRDNCPDLAVAADIGTALEDVLGY